MTDSEDKKLTILLDPDVHRAFKTTASGRGSEMTAEVRDFIRRYVGGAGEGPTREERHVLESIREFAERNRDQPTALNIIETILRLKKGTLSKLIA